MKDVRKASPKEKDEVRIGTSLHPVAYSAGVASYAVASRQRKKLSFSLIHANPFMGSGAISYFSCGDAARTYFTLHTSYFSLQVDDN
jgi:hypothetical protein